MSDWRQYFLPSGQLIRVEAPTIAAVIAQGASVPHDSTIKRLGDRFGIEDGGTTPIAAPTLSDNGAAEFDVALTGSGPWYCVISWVAAGLAALARGTYSRAITVTSAGASNSPLSIPVTIQVL